MRSLSCAPLLKDFFHDLTIDHMQQETDKFIEGVESNIGNVRQLIYDNTTPYHFYFSAFGENDDMDDPLFHMEMK